MFGFFQSSYEYDDSLRFNTEVNPVVMGSRDPISSAVSTLIGGTVASAVDVGATLWNSLAPLAGAEEVSTQSILERIGGDPLQVYMEHPNAVQAASLIGGSLIPGGIAVKGMNAARAGIKGANWFSKAGQTARREEIAEMLATGKQATSEFKRLVWANRATNAGVASLETVAAEALMLGTMHEHALLEDYWEDPVKNFGMSLLLGGGLGAVGGLITDNYAVRQLLSAKESDAITAVQAAVRPVPQGAHSATAIQENAITVSNLRAMLEKGREAGRTAENDLTLQMAQKAMRDVEKRNGELFDAMLSPEMRNMPIAAKQELMSTIINNAAFHGVDSIKFADTKELLTRIKASANLADDPTLTTVNKVGQTKSAQAAYFPEMGKFGSVADMQHYAGAAALGETEKSILKRVPFNRSFGPALDYGLEATRKSTPAMDADVIGWTLRYGRMSDDAFEKHLSKTLLAADDFPQIEAIVKRVAQNPELAKKVQVRIADRVAATENKLAGEMRTINGVPTKYRDAVNRLFDNAAVSAKYSLHEKDNAIREWVRGQQFPLQKSAIAYFAKGYNKSSMSADDVAEAAKMANIYESAESKALRRDLMQVADADGNIFVYRGFKGNSVSGSAPLESMALSVQKADQFNNSPTGKTFLYRVHVDDVVAAQVDVGPKGDNVELIVRASARRPEAILQRGGKVIQQANPEVPKAGKDLTQVASSTNLYDYMLEGKFNHAVEMLNRGYPMEVIAKRVSMPVASIEQFIASDRSMDAFRALGDHMSYKTVEEAVEALSPTKRPMVVSGSMRKADYTKGHANLNAMQMQQMNQLYIGSVMAKSRSPMVQSMKDMIFDRFADALAVVRTKLGAVSNSALGSVFGSSADHAARGMGDVGAILGVIGKDLTHMANTESKRLLEPISDIMAKIPADDMVALTELNTAYNLNSSLQGYRIYKDRQFWQRANRLNDAGEEVTVLEPVMFRGQPYRVTSQHVDDLLNKISEASADLYEYEEVFNKIVGKASNSNIGFWMPSVNPVGKEIAYVHNRATDTTQMLYGKTTAELEDAIQLFTDSTKADPNVRIIRKSDQEWWSYTNGRTDAINMTASDVSRLKTGSAASAVVPLNRDVMSEIVGGFEHYINASVRKLADVSMSDITDAMRQYSSYARRNFDGQPLGTVQRWIRQPKDAGAFGLNLLLGNSMLGEYEGWKTMSRGFEYALGVATGAAQSAWQQAKRSIGRGGDASKIDFDAYNAALAEAGAVNPFAGLDAKAFEIAQRTGNADISKRVVSASNGLAATMALRFGEIAHPIVNLMSMPILMALNNGKNLPSKFLGAQKRTAQVPTSQIMYEGVRAVNSPRFAALNQRWGELGYFEPLVSEATKTLQASRKFEKGATAAVERALESNFVKWASWGADKSEQLSRQIAMNTGYQLGKRLYPELDDNALTIFARDFMDKSLGNYSAAQRPVMFQGTLGMALGLFQTYMLTMAQAMYRNVEMGDWKTLAKGMLAQSTIFGASSLPGFGPISDMIGEHFSEEHYDLTTGTFRAIGDAAAEFTLFGLPSALTQTAFYTRGDIDPRVPNVLNGVENIVGVNVGMQAANTVKEIARSLGEGSNAGQAMLQALSLQTLSRPLARGSEMVMGALGTGGSLNQAGKTIQTAEEVMTVNGIFSRVLSSRPLAESKLREAQHMNRFYEAADRENRQEIVNQLRTSIRAGTLTDARMASIAEAYMRNGGSPAGWNTALRNAMATTLESGVSTFQADIDDSSPFLHMMDSIQ